MGSRRQRDAAPTGPAVGTIAPDFKVRNLVTGEDVTLTSQHGKIVILTFWASWCGPCKRELPILENAQRAVGKDKLVVFAVSYRDTPAALAAIKKPASNWQINVMTDRNARVAKHWPIQCRWRNMSRRNQRTECLQKFVIVYRYSSFATLDMW